MIHRETVPTAWQGCEISIVTERLGEGRWAVVAGISQTTPDHTRTIDLPVPSETFATEEEAKAYGLVDEVIKSRKEAKLLDGAAPERSTAIAEAALPHKVEE